MRSARSLPIVVLIAATASLTWPVAAPAGTYGVHACDAAVAGAANNAFVAAADAGMTAYTDCPAGQGLTVRNVWDNGQTSAYQGAFMIFDAPGGSTVESISYDAGYQRHNCSWSVSLVASGYDLGGTRVWGLPPGSDCSALEFPGPTSFAPIRWSYAIGAPRVRIESRCGAPSCPRDGVATLRMRNVLVTVRDEIPPVLTAGRGSIWTYDGWLSGTQSVGFDAHDAAGVKDIAIRVDEAEIGQRSMPCDYTQRAPCPSGALDRTVSTAGWGADGSHTVSLHAVDAAGNATSTSRTVRIDNTAPDAPQNLTVDGGDGWRPTNDFDARWQNVPQQAGSPIAGAEFELCPVAGTEKCVRGSRDGRDLVAVEDLKLPAPGEYLLRVWLRDAAGNHDRRVAAPELRLRYDDASPELAFEPLSAEDPTRLSVATTDRGSGVVAGQIEMRRRGTELWAKLPTVVEGTHLVARLDDERLGDGLFELRARAADHAGNERSTDRLTDGRVAEVSLPLRLKTTLKGGVVRKRGRRTTLAKTARVGYGRVVRVRGRLLSAEGNPLQDFEVHAFSHIRDGVTPAKLLATVRTSRTGRFSFLVRRGPSRTIRLRYGGTSLVRSATRVIKLDVRSRTTIRPNRRSYANGETARFRGRIQTGRIPQTGKLVELQVKVRSRWRTFATTRSGRRGSWHYDYRFDGTTRRTVYRFRARVPREAGYPFVTGNSRVVRVGVRGA